MAAARKSKKELLRQKAQKLLSKKFPIVSKIEDKDLKKLIHGLQVHQVELEMQNEELRKARREIEESRSRYSDLLDFAPVGYFTFSQAGEIVEVNLTGASLLGVARTKLLHRPFLTFVDPEFRSLFSDHRLSLSKKGKKERCELKLIKKDGKSFYASLQSISIPHGKSFRIRSAVSDISALKKAQEKAEIEHSFRIAVGNSILPGIIALDLEERQSYVNLSFCRMVGWTEEELLGKRPPFAYWPPEELDNINRAFQTAMNGKVPREGIQLRFMRKNGERFDALFLPSPLKNHRGKVIGWIGTIGDITHLRQIEKELKELNTQLEERVRQRTVELQTANQELRESEAKFRILADNTYDLEFWMNPEGRIAFMSPSCKRITGHDASDFMEDPDLLRTIVHPEDLPAFDRHRQEEKGKVRLQEFEFRIKHADGSIRWIGHVCQPIFDEEGRFLGIRGSNRGITKRKRAEKALRESEAKFRELANASPAAVIVYRGNKLLYVNPAAELISGYTRDELLTMDISDVAHPDHREMIRQQAQARMTGDIKEARYEMKMITKAGAEKWVYVSSTRAFFDGLPAGLIVSIDITGLKQAEEALAESKERYRSLATNIPSILIRYDKDLRILFISPKAEEITGVPIRLFIDKTNRGVRMPEHLRVLWDNAIQDVFRTGQARELDFDFASRKGARSYYLLLAPEFGPNGEVKHVLGIATDITERKQMEEALRRSRDDLEVRVKERTAELTEAVEKLQDEISERKRAEETVEAERQRFNDVLEMLPAYVVLLTPDHYVRFANRVFRERFGKSEGRCCYEFLFGRSEPCEICGTYVVLETMSPHHWEWTGPDGRIYDIFDFPFPDIDGSPLILEMGLDITDRKRVEAALRESETRLRYLSSELLTVQENERKSIARELHDGVGQLLTAVKFKIESALQLKSKKQSLETVVPLLRESIEEVRRVQMDLRPSTLDDLGVLATLEWFFREYQKIYSHIRIEKKPGLKESDVPVPVKTVIYRVTQEALNNIAKHSKADLVRFSLDKKENQIELTIRDNGIGFDLEQVIDREGSRRGLGLTSMKERIQLSGGVCIIESTPGKGTTLRGIWTI